MRTTTGRSLALIPAVALVLGLSPAARAQVDPVWDHYKVYFDDQPYLLPQTQVVLQDYLSGNVFHVNWIESFANPAEKQLPPPGGVFPIHDPDLHYSWWAISTIIPPKTSGSTMISVSNQFGDQTLGINGYPRFLLAPALKNQPGTPPLKNHYTCYECSGQPVTRNVTLVDQFDTWSATAMTPVWFCVPAQKTTMSNMVYPIVDPRLHYVVYDLQPGDPNVFTATFTDQFVTVQPMTLRGPNLLMVPTERTGVTPNSSSTWGRLKRLYR